MIHPLDTLKARRVDLRAVREVLRGRPDHEFSADELGRELGVTAKCISSNLDRWRGYATGVRIWRHGGRGYAKSYQYEPPEDSDPYEPATPTFEEYEQEIDRLERKVAAQDRELVRLRAELSAAQEQRP